MKGDVNIHEQFLRTLNERYPKKKELVNLISGLLNVEKDVIYRRLAGRVCFSAQEIGVIAKNLNISLDALMHNAKKMLWLPFIMESPLKVRSMEELYRIVEKSDFNVGNEEVPAQMGNIYHTLPLEFFAFFPILTKYMFFRWGYYFIGSEEFNDFSAWQPPEKLNNLCEKLVESYAYEKCFYIWDEALVWNLCREASTFHRMRIISDEEKIEIADALKKLLSQIEKTLNGTYAPRLMAKVKEVAFYVSSMHLGFNAVYMLSEINSYAVFHTNFSFSIIQNEPTLFVPLQQWIDSFKSTSTQLSGSGRTERRIFFDTQYRIIEHVLGGSDVPIY